MVVMVKTTGTEFLFSTERFSHPWQPIESFLFTFLWVFEAAGRRGQRSRLNHILSHDSESEVWSPPALHVDWRHFLRPEPPRTGKHCKSASTTNHHHRSSSARGSLLLLKRQRRASLLFRRQDAQTHPAPKIRKWRLTPSSTPCGYCQIRLKLSNKLGVAKTEKQTFC